MTPPENPLHVPLLPGLYRHFKGGLYYVLFTAEWHAHNGDIDVVYIPLREEHGRPCTRPLKFDSRKEPAWCDMIEWPNGEFYDRFMPEALLETLGVLPTLKEIWSKSVRAAQ